MRSMPGLTVLFALLPLLMVAGCGQKRAPQQEMARSEGGMSHEAQVASADDPYHGAMITCPVTGEKVLKSKAARMTWEGREIYFCCEGCIGPFKADPAKYMASVEANQPREAPAGPGGTGAATR